ncbi:MAG: ABC transporter substrate-binding protein [Nitrososphaerales archaeon]
MNLTASTRNNTPLYFVFLFASLLLISGALPISSTRTSGQSSTSCPSNEIFHATEFGGAPNSFNLLTAAAPSAWNTLQLMYTGVYPTPLPNGTLDYTDRGIISWIQSNSNYTQWQFNLRSNAKWSDGTNITSQDILRTFSAQFALNPAFDIVGAHTEITSETAPNSTLAVFNLNTTDAHFPEKLSDLIFTEVMPQSFISHGVNFTGFGTTDVASGPFYVSNYSESSTQSVLYRNQFFNPLPGICEIIYNYVESDSQVPTFLIGGTADFGQIESHDVASIMATPNLHVLAEQGRSWQVMTYNATVYPYNMTAFRQALAFGINESEIQQTAFNGYAQTAYTAEGGIPPVTTKYYNPNQTAYSFNPSNSLSLLKNIGFTQDSSGNLHFPNGTAVSLTLWYDSSYAGNTLAANIIQINLASLGITVTLQGTSLGNIIGDTFSNANGIGRAMILFDSPGPIFGSPYLDALPWYQVSITEAPYPTWEGDSVGQAQYQSNLTALTGTANPTLEAQYLNNIQALNAKYLPALVVSYPDNLYAYSTARFTGWPSNNLILVQNQWNWTAIAGLQPVSTSSTSLASSSTSSGPSTTTTSAGTSVTSSSASSSTTSSTSLLSTSTATNTGTSNSTYYYIAAAVVIVIVAVAALAMRRKPK